MADKIKVRRDSSTNWGTVNPVLDSGEIGFETNTRKIKVGDGSTQWSLLPYAAISQADLESAMSGKANWGSTLAAYGITNAYTKTEADTLLNNKADKSTTYTKVEVDGITVLKADKTTTYTKTESDTLLNNKADKSTTYTKVESDILFNGKADKTTTYTKTEVDTLVASTVGVPNLGASTATAISSTNMTLNGSVISFGATDKEALSIGFEYRVVGETIWSTTAMVAKNTLGDFSASISGLSITTNYEFRAKATDSLNPSLVAYSEVATAMTTSNAIPTNATNTGSFASQLAKGSVTEFTFSGATDSDGTVTHYLVDNISSANLTVTTAEVAAGAAHTFNVSGGLSADEVVTFSVKAKDNAGSYSAGVSVSVTLKNVFIATPTLTVTGTPTDVPETPTLTTSAFSVSGGIDTHASTDWQVLLAADDSVVWESLADASNLLSVTVPAGNLSVSTAYKFKARHNGTTYGSSAWVEVSGTTKAAFAPEQGQKGFGIEPCPAGTPFALLGLAEMTGTNEVGHDNYGNYIHTNGSIVCHYIKKYYRVGHPDAPQYATYGLNSLEMVPLNTFANEAEANSAGWILHRTFIDGGAEKDGFVRFKYLASKSATDANKAVSVKNGNPIGLTTNTTYTPSSTMTGCTGILADAVTLSRAIGAGWNNESVFMIGWSAMISIAQAQRAANTADVAWYDATYNFPKGCNNGSRQDVNDTSVSWTVSPDTAAKGLTGSASNFAKSTDNGANNGCADVNGLMYQVALGMTNYGISATDSTQITTNTIYVLKKTAYLKDLTAGWDGVTDAWGNTTNLATRYDAVTSPITISASATVYWGSGANQVLSPDTTGVAHDLCGFLPKNDAAADATGTSQFGTDRMYKYNRTNMYPYTAGYLIESASAGVFFRNLTGGRSGDIGSYAFRAAAYVS